MVKSTWRRESETDPDGILDDLRPACRTIRANAPGAAHTARAYYNVAFAMAARAGWDSALLGKVAFLAWWFDGSDLARDGSPST